MKKFFTIILTLMLAIAIAVSTSGCMVITAIKKEDHKNRILSMLKEKYGEEFEVLTIDVVNSSGFSGGLISGRPRYKFTCSPVANKEVIFNAATMENDTTMSDNYPHAVVKHLIKVEVDGVISKYSDNYALDIYFREPSEYNCEDKEWGIDFLKTVTPFTNANEITIESYSEKYLETAKASIYIAFEGNEYASIEKTEEIIEHFTSTFHKMHVRFIFLFTSKEEIDRCNALLADPTESVLLLTEIEDSPVIRFKANKGTDYKIIFDKELSKLNPYDSTTKETKE